MEEQTNLAIVEQDKLINQLEQKNRQQQLEISSLQLSNQELRAKLNIKAQSELDVSRITGELTKTLEKFRDLEEQLRIKQVEIYELQQQVKSQQKTIESQTLFNARLKMVRDEYATREKELVESVKENAKLRQSHKTAHEQLQKTQDAKAQLEAQVLKDQQVTQQLQVKLLEMQEQLNGKDTTINELGSRISNLEQAKQALLQDLAQCARARDGFEKQVQYQAKLLEDLKINREDVLKGFDQHMQIEKLSADVKELKQANSQLQSRIELREVISNQEKQRIADLEAAVRAKLSPIPFPGDKVQLVEYLQTLRQSVVSAHREVLALQKQRIQIE